jgi:hypothetical protein
MAQADDVPAMTVIASTAASRLRWTSAARSIIDPVYPAGYIRHVMQVGP